MVFALFYTVFQDNFQVQAPRGLYSEGRLDRGFFCVTSLGGFYLEGFMHGGACFQNFTVSFLFTIIAAIDPGYG